MEIHKSVTKTIAQESIQVRFCHFSLFKNDTCHSSVDEMSSLDGKIWCLLAWPCLLQASNLTFSECRCLETSKFRVQLPYGPAILSAEALQASNTKCRCPTDQQSQNAVACRTAMSAVAPQASNTQASGVQLPCRPAIHYHRQSAVALQASNTHRMCCLFPCVASPLAWDTTHQSHINTVANTCHQSHIHTITDIPHHSQFNNVTYTTSPTSIPSQTHPTNPTSVPLQTHKSHIHTVTDTPH